MAIGGEFNLGDALINIGGRVGPGLNAALGDAERQMKRGYGNILAAGRQIGAGMTAVGAGIAGALGFAAAGAADFDKAMREVNTLINLSEEDYKALTDQTIALSNEIGVGAVDSAKALYQAISAGVPKENAIDFLRVASKAAIGGVSDTKTAVDGLTTVINAFKMPMTDAQRVADVMFTTVKTGKTTFDELSQAIFQVAPLASSTGVKFEEVTAAISTLTKQGVPTSVATTQIRAAIQGLIRPSEDMTAIFQKAGFESGEMAIKQIGLQRSLEIVQRATEGNKGELTKLIGSIEGVGATLGITGDNAKMFTGDLDAAKSAAGASTTAYNEMNESASRKYDALKVQMANMRIEIGNKVLPVMIELFERVKPIIFAVTDWIQKNPELTTQIVIWGAALSGVLLTLGPMLVALPALVGVAVKLWAAMKFVGITTSATAFGLKGLAAMLVAPLAAAGIIAGVAALVETFYKLVTGASDVNNFITRWIDNTFPAFGRAIDKVFDKIVGLIDKFKEWIGLKSKDPELGDRSQAALASGRIKIPAMAGGGVSGGGLTLVGEHGPELRALPAGTRVVSNEDSKAMMRDAFKDALRSVGFTGGNINLTVNTSGKMTPQEAYQAVKQGLGMLKERRA